MSIQKDCLYLKTHEWVKFITETTAQVGISDFAVESLGDIVFLNLPQVGDTVSIDASFADVESVKAVSDVFCPISGVVTAVNEALADAPEQINEHPYDAWFIEVSEISARGELLTPEEYEQHCAQEE